MNNTAEMITIAQAEKLTGLARSTLTRFAEAGYFATDSNERGEQLVELSELCKLFNIDQPANSDSGVNQNDNSSSESAKIPGIGRTSADFAGGAIIAAHNKTSAKVVSLQKRESAAIALTTQLIAPAVKEDSPAKPAIVDESEQAHELRRLQNLIRGQEHEILKLQKVIELQEQLLETREAELRDHKKQRKWLQERLEKQDLKSERDQLLLISEMQMLTKMYLQQNQKKSVVIQALEWLGFKNPQADQTTDLIHQETSK